MCVFVLMFNCGWDYVITLGLLCWLLTFVFACVDGFPSYYWLLFCCEACLLELLVDCCLTDYTLIAVSLIVCWRCW